MEICQKFDVKPEETLMIEDSSNGVQATLARESSCYKRSGSASDSGRTTGKMRGSSERFSSGDSVA
ncbi:MAG: hypothetical protein ACLVH3_17430 [Blautia obeum]